MLQSFQQLQTVFTSIHWFERRTDWLTFNEQKQLYSKLIVELNQTVNESEVKHFIEFHPEKVLISTLNIILYKTILRIQLQMKIIERMSLIKMIRSLHHFFQ